MHRARLLVTSSLSQLRRLDDKHAIPKSVPFLRTLAAGIHWESPNQQASAGSSSAEAKQQEQYPLLANLVKRGLYNDDVFRHVKSPKLVSLEIKKDGRMVDIEWEDGHMSRFHSMWLRHNCHCEDCRLDHNGMITMDFRQIDVGVKVTSVKMEGDKVVAFTWEAPTGETHHEGYIPTHWLRHYCYSKEAEEDRSRQRQMTFRKEKSIPEVQFEDVVSTDEGLYEWLSQLSDYGISLIKNVPKLDGIVGKVAEMVAPLQHTVYGETFNVVSVPQPINAAYSPVRLDLHMDQIHYESPPGLQLLHCVEFDDNIVGGHNTFADIHEIAHHFRAEKPELFDRLARTPVIMQTIHYNRDVPVHLQFQRPLFVLNHKKELVSVTWHPMLVGPLQIPEEEIEPFYEAYKEFYCLVTDWPDLYRIRMVGGDMITFNNRRVLHGRAEFSNQTSKRFLQGTYLEISEFQSRVQVFHNKMGDGRLATRCGSFSYL